MINIEGNARVTIPLASKAIADILKSSAGDAVKIAAIEAIGRVGVNHTTITNSTFTGKP